MPESTDNSGESTPKFPTFIPSSSIRITKLTRTNYHLWKAQIVPYLRGQGVFGYLDGTIKSPPPTITGANSQEKPNPEYAIWSQSDNTILSTITSSLSEDVLTQVYTATSSAAIWNALQTPFASQSRAKLVQLRTELAATRKNESTATDYYYRLKKISDELALAGHPLQDDDFIAYLLAGLGPDYDALVTNVSCRPSITIDELYALLLTTESRLNHHRPLAAPPAASPAPISAHYADSAIEGWIIAAATCMGLAIFLYDYFVVHRAIIEGAAGCTGGSPLWEASSDGLCTNCCHYM